MNLASEIDLENLPLKKVDRRSTVEEFKIKLIILNLLAKGTLSKGEARGCFEDDLWAFYDEIKQNHRYIEYSRLKSLKLLGCTEDFIVNIKCWCISLLNYLSPSEVCTRYSNLVLFLENTGFLSFNFLNETSGFNLNNLFEEMDYTEKTKLKIITDTLNFLDFIATNFELIEYQYKYIEELEVLKDKYSAETNVRTLPAGSDVFLFGYYVDRFFEENKIKYLKIIYMPILLWWKITNIIPMRPSEFTSKLKRDCLEEKDGVFYLKIGRIKNSDKEIKSRIPILNKISINENIYKMIKEYIELTDKYGEVNTLISYPAIVECKKALIGSDPDNTTLYRSGAYDKKIDDKSFSFSVFYKLLDSFYSVIIKGIYKDDKIIDKVNLNDTRHFAFTSLMLQGVSPLEIAILGGHRTLEAQEHYQTYINYYLDSELFKMLQGDLAADKPNKMSLKKSIFDKSKKPPKPLENCISVGIGYCTADIVKEPNSCENSEFCCFCSKWWCEPTVDNYMAQLEELDRDCISSTKQRLEGNLDFIRKLFKECKLIDIEGTVAIDYEQELQIKRLALGIKKDADKLIELRYELRDSCEDTNNKEIKDEKNLISILNPKTN